MKISKLYRKDTQGASKVIKTNNSSSKHAPKVKHDFRVISADEINNNRSNAYQYLAF
ncbi:MULTISPECIES: hypothetical protein [Flavobacterium]|jgi:hypothetical protein|uniref:hypothetical protein n=1 Tax=Flavobacterium TaxID=237 RepID=UPI0013E99BB2|nr:MULTISPECIES: hypothetical protein [Flavobacterium]MCZ8170020.1 hypothetical protein [Flavobacterium sp.]MCZ8297123.1 hypothetical protein [Flavobacterium sp.]